MTDSGKRIKWIDALKGMAIIFVIFGHEADYLPAFFLYTNPLKICLFFAVAGYLFNDRNGDIRDFLKRVFFRLCIPWVFLDLLPFRLIAAAIQGSSAMALRSLQVFFSGDEEWFMPSFIVAYLIHFFVRKYIRKKESLYLSCLLLCILGLILARLGIGNFAYINTALTAQAFMAVGLWIRTGTIFEKLRKKRAVYVPSGVLIYIALGLFSLARYPGQSMNIKRNLYHSYLLCGALIVTGLVLAFLIAEWIGDTSKTSLFSPLAFIGQYSIVYYLTNQYVRSLFSKTLARLGIASPPGWPSWFINTAVILAGCTVLSLLLNRFLPFLIGKGPRPFRGRSAG